ncbi:MAG: hypothetical protein IJ112_04220 [Oscillospiraceae bacterium]|nr:hypothetical protein [Oscillospiraceae bacterium]
MELMLKNIKVAQMLESAGREIAPEMRMDEMAQIMLGGYVQDVLEYSEEAGYPLDLTYGTIDKLPFALAPLYRDRLGEGEGEAAEQKAAVATAKHLAAYLFALAMNEHNCVLSAKRVRLPMLQPDPKAEPAWVNNSVRIQTGMKRQMDFLPVVLDATGLDYFHGEKPHLHIEPGPIRRAYRSAIGVDLEDHGYPEMVFQG